MNSHKIELNEKRNIELVSQPGFEVCDEADISEEHKAIVRERIKSAKPEDLVSWTEARKQFNFKS